MENGWSYLKETIPKLSRVAVLGIQATRADGLAKRDAGAARALKVKLQFLEVRDPQEFESAFRGYRRNAMQALFVTAGSALRHLQRKRIVELASENRLPAMYHQEFVEAGGLMSYGPNFRLLPARRRLCGQDPKGAKPADLPVEQPKKFELIINLKAAKQIGLTIPPNVLARADKVIR